MKNIYKVNEEAVKKIAERVYDNGSTVINRNDLEEMFPELKEKENITNQDCYYKTYTELVKRLEKVKDAVKKQNYGIAMDILCTPYPGFQVIVPTDWSEKYIADVFEMVGLAKIVREQGNDALTEALQSAMIELAKYSVVPQIRQEWSEEDKKMLESCCGAIAAADYYTYDDKQEMESWLKSLKPQNRWKPSEEQIKALKEAVDEHFDIDGGALWHLYQELKNLKE